ncbi:uncharacterized protein G2W53_021176 [Senna tora]|uniref:Uncharacterized protein n=1 Tax=Senna tora TaxID=362788 RepID=A0A834TIW3_9FABA|nr:uncharacterized protein G2W53_021176 [Senna tora]
MAYSPTAAAREVHSPRKEELITVS